MVAAVEASGEAEDALSDYEAALAFFEDCVELLAYRVKLQTCVDDAKAAWMLARTIAVVCSYRLEK